MYFNSYLFLFLFLPFSVVSFRYFEKRSSQHILVIYLLVLSIFFYSYWSPKNLLILVPSILLNFIIGHNIRKSLFFNKKFWLGLGILLNLSAIGYFKYSSFILSLFHMNGGASLSDLPLGISFFTFTQISYLIDAYYNKAEKANLSEYALFVTYFPHLISGPLLHHKDMITQFRQQFQKTDFHKRCAIGCVFLAFGLFKKVIIADRLAPMSDHLFNAADMQGWPLIAVWKGVIAYTAQLYFDFSGYSDMAVGISKFFAIDLPYNFNSPYKARSIGDFWRRWHMSLSSFLKDYVYIPLGGNRSGFARKLLNLFIVMVICGIWHGAGYGFILWGALHGLYLIVMNLWDKTNLKMPRLIAWFLTMLAVMIAWVFFRALTVTHAIRIIKQMFTASHLGLTWDLQTVGLVIAMMIAVLGPNTQEIALGSGSRWYRFSPNLCWALLIALLFSISLFKIDAYSPFLYFQF